MKYIISVIILIFLFSCQKEKKLSLEGSWHFDTIVSYDKSLGGYLFVENEIAPHYNFTIKNDSIIHFNKGFFKRLYINSRAGASFYLGTETKYFLKDSLLIYFDKYVNKNDTIEILESNSKELLIKARKGFVLKLLKQSNKYFDNSRYDAVVVNRSPCYGICPFNFTYLDRNGNFYFKNLRYNTSRTDIATKLDKNSTNNLFDILDKIDFERLEDEYYIGATDSQTNTISFFKNGKIIKTISTYIKCPPQLEEAINELSFAYQNLPEETEYESILGNESTFGIQFTDSNLMLLPSEANFLEVELSRAKKVNIGFNEKYQIDLGYYEKSGDYKKIITNGRYYKFLKDDNSTFTVDLGYNFIELNPILKEDRYN
jgi:hypothetical protein